MKQFKTKLSKMFRNDTEESRTSTENDDATVNSEEDTPAWTTGQEFQFYVPWLWKGSPEPPPDKLHPNRQVVRIPRPTILPGFTEELRDTWIQHCVTDAVKDLVYDKDHYLTCTERQLEEWHYDRTKAWKRFNIVQSKCDLPAITVAGYDGVLPVEMTIAIKRMSIRREAGSFAHLEWLTFPSPGKCIERIKNQIRIILPPDCSMHIHVRPETMLDFDLQSFKRMASILWLAEERLDKLYHPARSDPDSHLHRSLRRYSNLALEENPFISGCPDDYDSVLGHLNVDAAEKIKLASIWQTADRHQLRELLRIHPSIGKHDYPAYNFFNLFMSSDKQTIEFRKTESTIDAQVIDAWIEVFVLLTNFCMTCSVETFQSLMENLGKPQSAYSTWNMLADIGCKRPIVELLKNKFMQQWVPEEPAASNIATSSSSSATRRRLRDAIREGAEKVGKKIAEGYSFSG